MSSTKNKEEITPRIINENISDALKKNAKTYADEANLRRAFPYVLSGLKPVQLHILWAMYAKKRFHDKPYTKSAIIVGEFVNLLGIFNYAIYDVNKDKPIGNLKTDTKEKNHVFLHGSFLLYKCLYPFAQRVWNAIP